MIGITAVWRFRWTTLDLSESTTIE